MKRRIKAKVFFLVGAAIMGVLLSSCEDKSDSIIDDDNTGNDPELISDVDLETMYMMQSNPELILADRIISKSTGFILDISKQEASELQIPDELYQKYVDKVDELNKQEIYKSN